MSSLAGKTICFTGTLSMKRADATRAAEAAGAKVGGSVTAKTDILVAGPGAGAKEEQARAKGVDVWTEAQFVAAVSGGGGGASSGASMAGAAPAAPPPPAAPRAPPPPVASSSSSSQPLAGKSICFTGTLSQKRSDAEAAAKAAGATVKSGVSAALDILVAGPGAGSKLADAEKKGVAVWTEAQFDAAVSGGGGSGGGSPAQGNSEEPARKRAKAAETGGSTRPGVTVDGTHRTLDVTWALASQWTELDEPMCLNAEVTHANELCELVRSLHLAAVSASASAAFAVTRLRAHGEVCDMAAALRAPCPGYQELQLQLDSEQLSAQAMGAIRKNMAEYRDDDGGMGAPFWADNEMGEAREDNDGRIERAMPLKHAAALCVLLQSSVLQRTSTEALGCSEGFLQGDSMFQFLAEGELAEALATAVLASPSRELVFNSIPIAAFRAGAVKTIAVYGNQEGPGPSYDADSGHLDLELNFHDGNAHRGPEEVTLHVLCGLLAEGGSASALTSLVVHADTNAGDFTDVAPRITRALIIGGAPGLQTLTVKDPCGAAVLGGDFKEQGLDWLPSLVAGAPSLSKLTILPDPARDDFNDDFNDDEKRAIPAALRRVAGATLTFFDEESAEVAEDGGWATVVAAVEGRPGLEIRATPTAE